MNKLLFSETFRRHSWYTACEAVDELVGHIEKSRLFIGPQCLWEDDDFLINPSGVRERGYTSENDFNYQNIWTAQVITARSKFNKLDEAERLKLSAIIEKAIKEITTVITTLNTVLLEELTVELLNGVKAGYITFEFLGRFIRPVDRRALLSLELVKNIQWIDLFAWKIPVFAPDKKEQSLVIGRCFWSLYNLESFSKKETEKPSAENMWSNRTRMLALAEVLESPLSGQVADFPN